MRIVAGIVRKFRAQDAYLCGGLLSRGLVDLQMSNKFLALIAERSRQSTGSWLAAGRLIQVASPAFARVRLARALPQSARGIIAHLQVDKAAREKARHKDTHPAHELADYASDYAHPAYGVMSIKEQGGALHWSWRGMFAAMAHRHYETFELPEVPDRLLPDKLALTFLTNRDGSIGQSLGAAGAHGQRYCIRASCGCDCPLQLSRTVRRQFQEWRDDPRVNALVLKPDNQPAYRLALRKAEGSALWNWRAFFVEFRGEGTIIDELIFHQPNGTFVARRVDE